MLKKNWQLSELTKMISVWILFRERSSYAHSERENEFLFFHIMVVLGTWFWFFLRLLFIKFYQRKFRK